MNKSKRQVGAVLIHRLNQKVCIILKFEPDKFTVRFEDGEIREYSLGSLESKFNLYDAYKDTIDNLCNQPALELSKYSELAKENEELKKQIIELKDQINNLESILNAPKPKHAGGRPQKLTNEQIEQMREYRNQGKSYREIAKIFNCNATSVFNKLN